MSRQVVHKTQGNLLSSTVKPSMIYVAIILYWSGVICRPCFALLKQRRHVSFLHDSCVFRDFGISNTITDKQTHVWLCVLNNIERCTENYGCVNRTRTTWKRKQSNGFHMRFLFLNVFIGAQRIIFWASSTKLLEK